MDPTNIPLPETEDLQLSPGEDKLPPFSDKSCLAFGYVRREEIGSGTFGRVVRAMSEGSAVAIKQTLIYIDDKPDGMEEIDALTILRGVPHVIQLQDNWFHLNCTYLVMDYFPFTLRQYWLRHRVVDWQYYTIQMLKGICAIHERGLMHRDLKPDNILIDPSTERLVIADLGATTKARVKERVYTVPVCTVWYRAPEMAFNYRFYTEMVDTWSVGCILFEMRKGIPLFGSKGTDNNDLLLRRIIRQLGPPRECDFPFMFTIPKGMEIQDPLEELNLVEKHLLRYDARRRMKLPHLLKSLEEHT